MAELVKLGQTLDIASAAETRLAWLPVLGTAEAEIQVAADDLKFIDTAGLQLLLAFQQDARRKGKKFSLSGDESGLIAGLATNLGLTSALADPD